MGGAVTTGIIVVGLILGPIRNLYSLSNNKIDLNDGVSVYTNDPSNQDDGQLLNDTTSSGSNKTNDSTQLQAWIYPGPTTCNVERELKSGAVSLTVLKPEYFTLNESGELTLLTESNVGCNGYSQENVALIKQFSQEQYVTVSGRIDFMRPFLRNGSRLQSEQQLVSFVVDNGMTGIEIDFEDFSSWTKEDYSLYLQFIESLGKQLQAKGKNLLVAGPPVSNSIEEAYYPFRYADFTKMPVHQIVVMAYDYQADQGNGEPVAPNSWVEGIIAYMKQVMPDISRVVMGIPAYGYTGTQGSFQSKLLTLQEAQKVSGFSQAVRDPNSFEMRSITGNIVLFYQDTISLQKKRQLVESQGITAISIWHLGGNAWF